MTKKRRTPAQRHADKHLRTGRPPKADRERQDRRISVSLTPGDMRRLTHAAKAAGLSKSAFIVKCLRETEGF